MSKKKQNKTKKNIHAGSPVEMFHYIIFSSHFGSVSVKWRGVCVLAPPECQDPGFSSWTLHYKDYKECYSLHLSVVMLWLIGVYTFSRVYVVENTNVSGCSDMWTRISSSILLICTIVLTIYSITPWEYDTGLQFVSDLQCGKGCCSHCRTGNDTVNSRNACSLL